MPSCVQIKTIEWRLYNCINFSDLFRLNVKNIKWIRNICNVFVKQLYKKNLIGFGIQSFRLIHVFIFFLIQTRFTRKSLDVSKKDGNILVSVDVDLPELRWDELSLRPLLLEGDVFYELLSNK